MIPTFRFQKTINMRAFHILRTYLVLPQSEGCRFDTVLFTQFLPSYIPRIAREPGCLCPCLSVRDFL